MTQVRLSPLAERDIEAILAWSHTHFGESVRLRYEALLVQAILDLAKDPNCSGSLERPELSKGACTYHLRHSRDHVSRSVGRIRRPRHLLLFRLMDDGSLEVSRVLHDSIDLIQHVPPDEPLSSHEPSE